jgi:3-hydroxybutyrate dehydrogenase
VSELEGRRAVVTGGGRGIGLAIARELAAQGASLVITGRNEERLAAAAEELGATAVVMDLVSRAAIEQRLPDLGQADILVNNAGVAIGAPLGRTDDETWDRIQQINVHGPFALMRALVPGMAARGWGRVINISSLAGLTGQAYTSAYCASKHALIGLTRALAVEYARKGVTINAICPGWVETDMAREAIDRIVQSTGRDESVARGTLANASPQGRLVTAEEVAALTAMLCGESARGIHGQAIPVDGGTVMR